MWKTRSDFSTHSNFSEFQPNPANFPCFWVVFSAFLLFSRSLSPQIWMRRRGVTRLTATAFSTCGTARRCAILTFSSLFLHICSLFPSLSLAFLTFVRYDAVQSVLAVYSPVRTTFTLIMFPTAGVIADVIGTNVRYLLSNSL